MKGSMPVVGLEPIGARHLPKMLLIRLRKVPSLFIDARVNRP